MVSCCMKKIIQYFMMQIISINITNRRNLSKKRGRIVIVRDIFNHANCYVTLGDKSRCSAGLVFPGGGKNTLGLVVPSQTMNSRLDQNEPKLGVLVLPIPLQMLANGDGLLDEEVDVLR